MNKIFEHKNTSFVFYLLFFNVVFNIFYEKIAGFIHKYFVLSSLIVDLKLQILIGLLFVSSLLFITHKLYFKKYRLSKINIKATLFSIAFLINLIYLPTKSWEFIVIWQLWFLKIDIAFLLLILLIAIIISQQINKPKLRDKPSSLLISDDPIVNIKDDKFNFEKQATQLLELIEKSNFINSFSIGIVASWGSGKSSFINILKEKVNSQESEGIISFEFLPYMSPQEDDIYIGFFNQLVNKLKPYSGELSNELINYADALLENYHKPSLKNLFSKHSTDLSAKSSLSLFDSINDTLKSLDKKIIVFIDELDRLSAEEIMQVLKLIRTSANFHNFVFCIAIDKEYVLKSLLSDNKIYEHSFIDKFFQLEVYLPQLNINDLKDDLLILLEENNRFDSSFIDEIKTALLDKLSKFDDYIRTNRDLKKLVNQLLLDKSLYPIKLNAIDVLNFTLLKMRFPSIIGLLKQHKDKILIATEGNYYILKKTEENNGKFEWVVCTLLKEDAHAVKYSDLEKEIIFNTLNSIFKIKDKEVTIDVYSLQFWTNLRSVLEMKGDSKLENFVNMFDLTYNELTEKLNSEENFEVLNYASYYPFLDNDMLNKQVRFLINLYCLSVSGKKYIAQLTIIGNMLFSKLENMYRQLRLKDEYLMDIVSEYLFDKSNEIEALSIIKFINFFEQETKKGIKEVWGIPFESILKPRVKNDNLLKRYFKEDEGNPPSALNIYRNYRYEFRLFSGYLEKEDLKNQFHEFFKANLDCLKTFCIQNIIAIEDYINGLELNISAIKEIYPNTNDFIELIRKIAKDRNDEELKDFSDFLQLLSLAKFTNVVYYEFSKFSRARRYIEFKYPNYIINSIDFDSSVKEFVLIGPSDIIKEIRVNFDVPNIITFNKANNKQILFIRYHEDDSFVARLKAFLKLNASNYKQKIPKEFFYYTNVIALEKKII